MLTLFDRIHYWLLLAIIFILPLFFLPTTIDLFDFNKQAFLVVGLSIVLIIWAARQVVAKRFTLITTSLDVGIILFAIANIVSTLVRTPNKIDALLYPGELTTVLAGTFIYLLLTQVLRDVKERVEWLVFAIVGSGVVVALVVLAASLGIFETIPNLPQFMKTRVFSPLGIPLATIAFLLLAAVLSIGQAIRYTRSRLRRDKLTGMILVVGTLFILVGLGFVASNVLTGRQQVRLLPHSSGWAIAVETLKVSPFGVGPANFLSAFNQYRPVSYNGTDLWNVRFSNSSNWYFELLTEIGIVGLVAFIFLMLQVLRSSGYSLHTPTWSEIGGSAQTNLKNLKISTLLFTALLVMFIAFLLIPAPFLFIIMFYILMAAFSLSRETRRTFNTFEAQRSISLASLLIVILLVVAVGIQGGRIYMAEVHFKQALEHGAKNNGQGLYDSLKLAIRTNPHVDRYHTFLSQANIALIGLIADRDEISEDDRKNISGLAREAIQEAKVAASLNTRVSNNWENLGRVYKSLMPIARGSDQWAVVAYGQAIALEPTNPNLRIALGQIWYSLGKYDNAAAVFELAVSAKRDLPNTHFNLAVALREKGDIERAITEMETVVALLDKETKDYEVAKRELDNLRSKLPEPSTTSGQTLTAPQPSPTPVLNPKLEISEEEASPPAPSEAQPSASPSPSPSPTL